MEFTKREQIIVRIVSYLINPIFEPYPLETKLTMIHEMLTVSTSFTLSKPELLDIVNAISNEQKQAIREALNKLGGKQHGH